MSCTGQNDDSNRGHGCVARWAQQERISLAAVSGIYPKPPPAVPLSKRKNAVLLKIHRVAHWLWKRHVPVIPRALSLFNRVVFAAEVPHQARIGRNVKIWHSGLGTVIHPRAVIGDNVGIAQGVVIGGRSHFKDVPVIEDDVLIGAGAKVLGPIRVGRGAVIGANAVVLHDVPAGAMVGGIPAKILRRSATQEARAELDTGT
jgi:serine O-acetyltransferase